MPKWIKIFFASLILIIFSFTLLMHIIFSGGITGAIYNLKPDPNPNSIAIQKSREQTVNFINDEFDNIEKLEFLEYYESSIHDQCYKGESSYKRVSGYATRCSYRITKYYGFTGDFRNKMIDFENHIYKFGWAPPFWDDDSKYPMREIMDESFEYEKTNSEGMLSYNGAFHFSELRKPYPYEKESATLELENAEKDTTTLFSLEHTQKVSSDSLDEIYDKRNFQDDLESLYEKIIDENNYVFAISIQKDYFKN